MPENSSILLGFIAILAGAMIGPVASDLWRKIKGSEYATKKDCERKHEMMEKDCEACRAATKSSICAIRHDGERNRKLLLLIAIKLQVPPDELKEYM